ncbi:hypothetical protein CDEST_08140 [Colletotrichum destructivum]|uniref:Uncharacterized protein n=1 Tax=Colletotrichum destructivum TaxID=34406 RepID=A0AAX4IJL7_9PEZI|nr:hypothetical protein CDEST_08140 [Colletotrichum destructivum]
MPPMPPTFSLSVKVGRTGDINIDNANPGKEYILETGCNEDGFSMSQITALTDIGASTKTKCKDAVSFKAVSRIADVVHVASGHSRFKLDNRHGMIGALCPLPCPFPASKFTSHSTRMMVQLKGQREHEVIERDLINTQPEILLFLQSLRGICVITSTFKSIYTATHTDDELHGETRAVMVHHSIGDTRTTKYIIVRKIVDNAPTEPRRKCVVTLEVTLAFPQKGDGSPRVVPQHIFAFLPTNYYSFRMSLFAEEIFLIQGDFILTASRESLAPTAWNEKLQETIPGAFEAAIHRSNDTKSGIRYSCPQYLEYLTTGIAFGKNLGPKLFKHPRFCRILRNCHSLDLFFMPGCLVHLAFDYAPKGRLPFGLVDLGVKVIDLIIFSSH